MLVAYDGSQIDYEMKAAFVRLMLSIDCFLGLLLYSIFFWDAIFRRRRINEILHD